jgi:poly(A) polymerase
MPNTVIPIHEPILRTIGAFADESGVEIYIVGGYVRDFFRGAPRKDLDFTLVGDAVQFAKRLAVRMKTHAVVYERFRTALVPLHTSGGTFECEFVGTRKEEYAPNSRKPVVTEGTFEDDIRRRDFTVNAMAISLNRARFGELVDMFGGRDDMERQILRTPLESAITFSDDPLRMMRAARFAAQLGFTVDEAALQAMHTMADRICIISQERVTDEFLKILAAPKPSVGLNILQSTGLMHYVFPEVADLAGVDLMQVEGHAYRHKDVFLHTLQVVDNVASVSDNCWLRFATLMHDIAKPKTKKFLRGTGWSFHGHEDLGARWQDRIFRRMKLPLHHLQYVKTLVRLHQRPMALVDEEVTDSAIRRLIVQAAEADSVQTQTDAHAAEAGNTTANEANNGAISTGLDDLFALCRADITTKNPRRAEEYLRNYDIVYQKTLDVRKRDNLLAFQSPVRGEEIMVLCGLPASRAIGILKTAIENAILDGIILNEYDAAKAYLLANKDALLAETNAPTHRRGDLARRARENSL